MWYSSCAVICIMDEDASLRPPHLLHIITLYLMALPVHLLRLLQARQSPTAISSRFSMITVLSAGSTLHPFHCHFLDISVKSCFH